MQTTTNAQMGLLDSLMIATPTNEFLELLDRTLDCQPVEKALQTMYLATTGRPPGAPLALFTLSLLQHCYGFSEPRRKSVSVFSWTDHFHAKNPCDLKIKNSNNRFRGLKTRGKLCRICQTRQCKGYLHAKPTANHCLPD